MAGKAKTAQKDKKSDAQQICPTCGEQSRVVQFAGFGKKGFYWVCEKNVEHAVTTSSLRSL